MKPKPSPNTSEFTSEAGAGLAGVVGRARQDFIECLISKTIFRRFHMG